MNSVIIGCSLSAVFLLLYFRRNKGNSRHLPLPPGPRPDFLLGNLKHLPSGGQEWVAYEDMSKEYGSDVIFLNVLGSPILSINSYEAADELLNKRGAVWSDRPRLPMIKELMGWDWNLVLKSYHEDFAIHRRIVQQHFQPNVVAEQYRPVMQREVNVLLDNLLNSPDKVARHLKRMAGAIIMMVTYGHQVKTDDDEYVQLAEEVRKHSEETPGAALVDTLPILKYLPAWMASFKRTALLRKQLAVKMREAPYQMVKEKMASGQAIPSMVSSLLEERFSATGTDDDEVIKNCGGVVYSAGADTTVAALTNFVLAMILYPHVQTRAHEELDRVIGRGRLPQFNDRESLPYINCIVKEVLRWKAVSPLGVPHYTTKADEFRGRYIPAKTTVLANISAMLHDEGVYKNAETFFPDRFMTNGEVPAAPDPARVVFGFGRRICPGRFFADDSIWLTLVSILHAFSITKAIDGSGREIQPAVKWSSGLVSMPGSFASTIEPRFDGIKKLISTTQSSEFDTSA